MEQKHKRSRQYLGPPMSPFPVRRSPLKKLQVPALINRMIRPSLQQWKHSEASFLQHLIATQSNPARIWQARRATMPRLIVSFPPLTPESVRLGQETRRITCTIGTVGDHQISTR